MSSVTARWCSGPGWDMHSRYLALAGRPVISIGNCNCRITVVTVVANGMQEEVADAEAAGPSIAEGGAKPGERRPRQQDRPKSHVADMLGAMAALQQQER